MNIQKIGMGLFVLGIFGIAASFLADYLPNGKPGIQSAQILGIEISISLIVAGIWLRLSDRTEEFQAGKLFHDYIDWILNLPAAVWVTIGFLIVYILFFISPIFLNDTLRMRYFTTYLPDRYPIGNDLIAVIDLMKGWFSNQQSPYVIQFYPPFTYVFFAPLLLLDNYPLLFSLFTLFSLACYFILTFLLPAKMIQRQSIPTLMLIFVTGLFSYGLQFELERGQYNVLTFLLCLWAIHIFHNDKKHRLIAYLLFSISIQLKLYPAIFIVMFVDDWKDWKNSILRFIKLAVFNLLLLFVMGYQIFLDFIRSVSAQLSVPGWEWNGNHSIKAFIEALKRDGLNILAPSSVEMISQNSDLLSNLLLGIFLLTFAVAIVISARKKEQGIDNALLLVSMIGALIIPISNDYTLSILSAPVALFLCGIPVMKHKARQLLAITLTLGISIAYFATLVPFKYKPYFLSNTFPLLFVILILVAILNLIWFQDSRTDASSEQPQEA
ncbi:MAG TPA: glycosyltransferase 87 family protein [Anaerolineales bacterium]|nr:glycosyltransferase 87 family protein [Anaerolineales bacterium]